MFNTLTGTKSYYSSNGNLILTRNLKKIMSKINPYVLK